MKEAILALRDAGQSYRQIQKELGCSKGTIAYHCGEGQKVKSLASSRRRANLKAITNKAANFQTCPQDRQKASKRLRSKANDFQRERTYKGAGKHLPKTFTHHDVMKKFGKHTTCYLTGRPVNLLEPKTYHFDHVVPFSAGGSCNLENLGIACKAANMAKSNMSVTEFLCICEEVLKHNGYTVAGPDIS